MDRLRPRLRAPLCLPVRVFHYQRLDASSDGAKPVEQEKHRELSSIAQGHLPVPCLINAHLNAMEYRN